MNLILDANEKKSMHAQLNNLSEEKIYLLAENDPIINKKEVEDQISNVLGLNSDMQNYTNSLEAQPLIRLEGYGLPDIIPVQTQAKKNAEYWRNKINPEISNQYTISLSLANLIILWGENDINQTIDEALVTPAGKENLLALMKLYANDANKCSQSALQTSSKINDFYEVFLEDGKAFQELYNQIDKIFNSSSGKRATLEKKLKECHDLIVYYNVSIGITSASLALAVLGSVLFTVIRVPSFKIIAGTIGFVGGAAGLLKELVQRRDEQYVIYHQTSQELNYINTQCAVAKLLNDNIEQSINLNGKITPQIRYLSNSWNTISNKYSEIERNIMDGMTSNSALLLKLRLKAAYKTAKELLPIFKQCQKNQLLPISVSNNLADTLLLPRSWANNYIDSDVFFEFLYTNKK